MYIFNLDLNSDSEQTIRRETGRLFHNFGPAIEKARSPLNFNLDLGTINTLFSEDLSGLEDVFGFKRSLRYSGAVPLRALKTNSKIWNSIL